MITSTKENGSFIVWNKRKQRLKKHKISLQQHHAIHQSKPADTFHLSPITFGRRTCSVVMCTPRLERACARFRSRSRPRSPLGCLSLSLSLSLSIPTPDVSPTLPPPTLRACKAASSRNLALSTIKRMDDGRWTMDNGRRTMDNGRHGEAARAINSSRPTRGTRLHPGKCFNQSHNAVQESIRLTQRNKSLETSEEEHTVNKAWKPSTRGRSPHQPFVHTVSNGNKMCLKSNLLGYTLLDMALQRIFQVNTTSKIKTFKSQKEPYPVPCSHPNRNEMHLRFHTKSKSNFPRCILPQYEPL